MARLGGVDRGITEKPKGSGIWWARWHDHKGKERWERASSRDVALRIYKERKAVVKKAKTDPDFRKRLEEMNQRHLTLAEYLRSREPELQLRRSWKDMKRFQERWIKILGDLPLTEVSKTHVKKRQAAQLLKGLKPATINRETSYLQARLQEAVEEDLLPTNPLNGFKKLREDNIVDRFLTESEEERLSQHMSLEHFEIVEMAIHTGIRQERLFALAWKHISFEDGGWITVENAKGGKSRRLPMTNRAFEILKRRHENRVSAWVFPNSTNGNPINPQNFYNRVYLPALAAAGIEDMTWHNLRKTFASRLAIAGTSIQKIQSVLGVSDSSVVERYAHLLPDTFRGTIAPLNKPKPDKGGLRVVK